MTYAHRDHEHQGYHGGISAVRERAYQESLRKLSSYRSLASQLTPEQLALLEEDLPFEIGQ